MAADGTKLDADRWRRVSALLDEALEVSLAERARWVERACAGDVELQAEVEALLAAADQAGDLLETPAADLAAPLLAASGGLDEGAEADADQRIGASVGPYRLTRKIGEGGMGAVYLAERTDGEFEHRVAVKLVRHALVDGNARRRFLAERQILARLQHPGIARLVDGGVTDGARLPYFAMEYVDGETVTDHCNRLGLDLRPRLEIFLQICDAVEYAHRSLVVHRDLKPSNILVDRAGRVRLLDFGIAKWLGDETDLGLAGTLGGLGPMTPHYAAPEQLTGDPVTTATDVYALGVLLCELLTGALPYVVDGTGVAQVRRAVLETEPTKPSALAASRPSPGVFESWSASLRGDLDQIVLKALRKEAPSRYASVDAFAADVRRYLDGYPVVAAGDAWPYRAGKYLRRHRVAVAAAAVLCVSIAAGVTGTVWQARRAQAEADRARAAQAFLVSLFKTTEPGAGAQNRTARDLLEQGAVRIDTELAGQPELQVELWRAVADVQRQMGDYDAAERLLAKALEVQGRREPADGLELARSRLQLAVVLNDHYRTEDADRMADAAVPVLRARLGDKAAEMGDAYDLLGSLRYARGDYTGAEQLRRQALEIYRLRFGERSRQVADISNNLAVFYAERGRYDEAEAAGRVAVDIRRALLGEAHPDTLLARYNLANALYQRGRWIEASKEFEAILDGQLRVLGPAHPHTALTRRQVARIFAGFGRYDEAADALVQVAQVTAQTYGEKSLAAGYVRTQQSGLEQLRGRFDDAVRIAREVVADFEQAMGADHVETAWARMNLGDRLLDAGGLDEAERALSRAAAVFGSGGGAAEPYFAQTLDFQGQLAARRGHRAEARAAFERALELFGDDAAHAFDAAPARWHLAAVLEGQEQVQRRAQLFESSLAVLRRSLPPAHTRISEAMLAYGRFLAEIGRPIDAERVLRDAFETRLRTLGAANVLTAEAADTLGLCLVALRRRDEGQRLLRSAAPVLSRYPYRVAWPPASPAGR